MNNRFDVIEKELIALRGEIKSTKWIVSINTGMLLGLMFMALKGAFLLS
ncbi:MAG: hypothetical protein BECKG1743D_GA0114223_101727 [Candidatus Kentron sp. G]|nr:MAG: hypothetical protein BECKG1743D_GA0114223_101727 [Candidatus Kentron sp. G]VFN00695.1 MAG: hypothetical protein BECKG1743F_GA0114225_105101 [Candidatus Kentron sp. G]VFN02049.1 MAG: hypothetical protein BECKG1743E_GA0114224_104661 [Candidatus Kentron sp. G]